MSVKNHAGYVTVGLSVLTVSMLLLPVFAGFLAGPGKEHPSDVPADVPGSHPEQNPHGKEGSLAAMTGWFTGNKGQIENPDVLFVYKCPECCIGFVESGYLMKKPGAGNLSSVVKVTFEGPNPVLPEGRELLPHRSSYFKGNDVPKWRTDVPNYGKVVFENLYNGIDLVFYTTGKGVKYDLVISPAAKNPRSAAPADILYSYEGVDDIHVDPQGGLHITTPAGEFVEKAPFSYQVKDGRKVEVPSRYMIEGKRVGIETGNYDPGLPLVIDPLVYSTYLGGGESDNGMAIVLDPEGNAYITGDTYSENFPVSDDAYDDSFNGVRDIFVFKLSSDGSEIIYSTFVGGNDNDVGRGIAVDTDGNVYVTGRTESADFPTTSGAYDRSHNGDSDVVVFKLNGDGSDLLYSTFVGGNSYEVGYAGVAVDPGGSAYVAGHTNSADFPTTPGAYDRTYYAAGWDGFAFKLNPDGSDLEYSTYFGGWDYEGARSIAIDAEGNAYLGGDTTSDDFPTTSGAYDETYNGGRDGFVLEFNSDGSDLVYSTFLGGGDQDLVNALELMDDGTVWVTGYTFSPDYPVTAGSYDDDINGERDIFITRMDRDGSGLLYSTFLGGQSTDEGWAVRADGETVYLGGRTGSEDFPVTGNAFDDDLDGDLDMVVVKLDCGASELVFSTYVGGSEREAAWGIALHGSDIFVTGLTASGDFPTTPGAYDTDYNGGHIDAVVLRMHIEDENPGGGGDGDDDDSPGFGAALLLAAGAVTVLLCRLTVLLCRRSENT